MIRVKQQRGIALISVMLIVALCVVLASQLLKTQRLGISRAHNMFERQQAFQYAKGSESFVKMLLTETLKEEEMFTLSVEEILYRLYHQEEVEVYQPKPVSFACTCSKERSAEALRHVEKAELISIIEEEGAVKMNCQYCHVEYRFDRIDVEAIHNGNFDSPSTNQ